MPAQSRIRVLRIIARMNVGGPALQVTALSNGLSGDRFEQRLLTGVVDEGEQDYRALRAPNVPAETVCGLGRAPKPVDDVRALVAIHREIRRFRPHILHTHTAKAGFLGRIAATANNVPAVVHSFHGHLLTGYFSPMVTRGLVFAERSLARRSTRLVAVGSQVRDDLLRAGIGRPEQYLVVPPGVDLPTPSSQQVARKELDLPADGPVIGFLGRLTTVKRPDRLLDVFAEVAARRPDAVLAIAGEGDLLDDVRRKAEPFGGRVRFLGWQRGVETVLSASDVVVLTSDNEGMPVSLIEAAAVGRPAVTTDVGSAREVVQDGVTGFVTGRDVASIADAVSRLLEDGDLRHRMGSDASVRAQTLFSGHRLVADTERLYEEIANEKGIQ